MNATNLHKLIFYKGYLFSFHPYKAIKLISNEMNVNLQEAMKIFIESYLPD